MTAASATSTRRLPTARTRSSPPPLKISRATKLFILTKTGAKTAENAKADLERIRKELGIETIDTLLIHCMMKKRWPVDMRPVIDVLLEAKQKGRSAQSASPATLWTH